MHCLVTIQAQCTPNSFFVFDQPLFYLTVNQGSVSSSEEYHGFFGIRVINVIEYFFHQIKLKKRLSAKKVELILLISCVRKLVIYNFFCGFPVHCTIRLIFFIAITALKIALLSKR